MQVADGCSTPQVDHFDILNLNEYHNYNEYWTPYKNGLSTPIKEMEGEKLKKQLLCIIATIL